VTELIRRRGWRTVDQVEAANLNYIEWFNHRRRRHSALGMLTPIQFELQHSTRAVTLTVA
jgi:transposase InsO family protein